MIITRELIPSKVSVRKRGRFSLKKRKLSYVSDFALPSSRLIAIFVHYLPPVLLIFGAKLRLRLAQTQKSCW